jgi:hypothetical protein
VIVDCLNLWVANIAPQKPELSDADLGAEEGQLEAAIRDARYSADPVSNEVGGESIPRRRLGRRFRDALGLVNQAAARAADEVLLIGRGMRDGREVRPTPPSARRERRAVTALERLIAAVVAPTSASRGRARQRLERPDETARSLGARGAGGATGRDHRGPHRRASSARDLHARPPITASQPRR